MPAKNKKKRDKPPLETRLKMTRNARISNEIKRLGKLFEKIEDKGKKTLINDIICETAFLKISANDCKALANEANYVTKTVNATQIFEKAHPASVLFKDFHRLWKENHNQLIGFLPEAAKIEIDEIALLRDDNG
ncbi:MAG: hypothetical protein FWG91_13805 [Lachnospiraceae bacterium]|nr:hypothetical protein [Lachnospiraceae bacterium]